MDDLLSRISIVLERQDFRMCVPPESDDTDIVLGECRGAIESLRQQLAAALAACETKDSALGAALSDDQPYISECKKALAIKPDASALKAHDIAVFRKGVEYAFEVTGGNKGLTVSDEEVIRELKLKSKDEN